nr:putative reverse transcriptase, RNA-dependent DNA polymerase [Tanacetum cinerariifolium]
MDSLSLQVVSAAKLPILKPNEFDLWKMRIKQYVLMTDYSLWKVILNGDSSVPTRVVKGVLQPVAPTTAKKISVAANVSAVCAKMHVSSLPNVDSLSNATGKNLGANGPTSMGFDMSKVECYNYNIKGHFARECRSLKDSRRTGSYDWSYQAEEEPANYALIAFSFSSSSSDNGVPSCLKAYSKTYAQFYSQFDKLTDDFRKSQFDVISNQTGTFMPPKPDLVFNAAPTAVETDHLAFNVQLSPTKPDQDLSHTTRPTTPIIGDWSSKQVKSPRHSVKPTETSIPAATPKPSSPKSASSGKRRNRKACFMCKSVDHLIKDCDFHAKKMAQPTPRNYAYRGNHKQYAPLTHTNPQNHMVPTAVLTQSKSVFNTAAARPVSTAVPKINVTRPRHAHLIVTKSKSPIRRHITRSSSSKTRKLGMETKMPNSRPCFLNHKCIYDPKKGNPQHDLKDKGVIDSGCSRHITGNMSYLSNFEELNGRYVSFGGNPMGGKISSKGKIKAGKFEGKVDEGVLVGYSPNVAGSGPTWLFDIDSLTKTMNYQPVTVGNQSNPSVGAYFDEKKPEFKFNVSPSSSAQSRKQDDKTKKEAKGKSHVESFTRYRDLSAEFEDFSDNSNNEVNATGSIVPIVRQDFPNSTNTFSAAGPLNADASLTFGKSSFIDDSQLLDDPDMPESEDITYSDDEDIIGADADFNNFETSITEEPKRVYMNKKDERGIVIKNKARLITQGHTQEEGINYEEVFAPVARIEAIRLFLAYASFMGFMVYQMDVKSAFLYGTIKEEVYVCQPLGFEDPEYPDKVYKVVKALYGLHQAPRAWYETLANYLLENGFQREKPLLKDPDGEDCKKQTVVATTSTKAEYVAATSYCAQVLWIQNQLLDYGLQALVDKKKVVVTEAAIKEVLRLDDAKGVDCLPNEEIFTELARMGYEKPSTKLMFYKAFFSSQWKFLIHTILQCMSAKRTSWNEFSSSMASAIICLSIEIEEERDEDDHVEEATTGDATYGDDSAAHEEVHTVTQKPSIPSSTLPTPSPQPPQGVDTSEYTFMDDESNQGRMIAEMDEDDVVVLKDDKEEDKKVKEIKVDESAQDDENELAEVQEVVDVVTTAKLITKKKEMSEKAAKRRKLNKEVEDLKRHLQIVPNEDDDVCTEATPLARKVPVVDYKIIDLNNKPHYKIIIADGAHQLQMHMLKSGRIKELYMVKSWKLLESCGVHIITFTTTQLILLVERRYLLSRFTLDQMLNAVRLQVEEESKVSLELLRFTRQQHQEGQHE